MTVRKRGESWQADFAVEKKRYRETFVTSAEAEAWEKAAREALKLGKPLPTAGAGAKPHSTMRDLLETIVTLDWGRKKGTKNSIRHAEIFLEFVGPNLSPEQALTQDNVDKFLCSLIKQNLSGSTINRYLSALSKMEKKALETGAKTKPVKLKWEREGQNRLRYFSKDEEALILQTLAVWGLDRFRDFFICLVDTGGRTFTEVRDLPWRDITDRSSSQSRPMVRFEDTKTYNPRSVPLTDRAWAAIQRNRSESEGPFKSLDTRYCQRIWDRIRAHLPQLEDTVLYTARHTFASRLVLGGKHLTVVMRLMGHKNQEQTLKYSHLAPQDLIDAIDCLEEVTAKPALKVVS